MANLQTEANAEADGVSGLSQQTRTEAIAPANIKPKHDVGNIVWLDMEMTGLDPDKDHIIELAMIVTDSDLKVLAVSEAIAVHQSDEILEGMDSWNKNTHGRSGLIDRVKASVIDERAAELAMLAFMKPWVAARTSPMAGNSICQDRRFMARYMPELEAYFHYRNLDVSTVKELCKRWRPEIAKAFKKRSAHTAIADIVESIDELLHYRAHFFNAQAASLPSTTT
jgi:oligoribonuclease